MYPLDPAQTPVVAECTQCRGEIYVGDEVYRIDDGEAYVHSGYGFNCARIYAIERVYDAEGTIGKHGEIIT